MNTLFSPLRLTSKHTLKNRLVVAPMTTSQSNPDGTVSLAESAWLERLAADGYGMIISCAAAISMDSIAFENQLSLGDDRMIPGLASIAERLRKYQCVSLVQLCHAGSRAIKMQPRSASRYILPAIPGFIPPEELTEDQIGQIVTDFSHACRRAEQAGFQGVEFHGANGYLFTQFISRMTNLRTDNYGGSLENRARFSRQVVQACRKVVSKDFIIGFRISFENAGMETGLDIDENIQIINWLAEDGISYAHASLLDYRTFSVKYPHRVALQYVASKLSSDIPFIGVGAITGLPQALQAMEYGADLVAIGRAAIGNRDLPKTFARAEELTNHYPFEQSMLSDLGISSNFLGYLRKPPVSGLNVVK